jgi:hypothetical protein
MSRPAKKSRSSSLQSKENSRRSIASSSFGEGDDVNVEDQDHSKKAAPKKKLKSSRTTRSRQCSLPTLKKDEESEHELIDLSSDVDAEPAEDLDGSGEEEDRGNRRKVSKGRKLKATKSIKEESVTSSDTEISCGEEDPEEESDEEEPIRSVRRTKNGSAINIKTQ